MANELKPWLLSTLLPQARELLDHFKGNQNCHHKSCGFEDSRRVLRRRAREKSRRLQITGIAKIRAVTEWVLSDKETSIVARLSPKLVESYQLEHDVDLTQATIIGAFVQLTDFEIVIDFVGGEANAHLTFFVKDATALGGEGNPTFGQPIQIFENPATQKLISAYAAWRTSADMPGTTMAQPSAANTGFRFGVYYPHLSNFGGIKKKDLKIPARQAKLLKEADRNNWLPPVPGTSQKKLNIPIDVLSEFTERVENSIRSESHAPAPKAPSRTTQSERTPTSPAKSDSSFGSESTVYPPWSPSPTQQKTRQLPPDSDDERLASRGPARDIQKVKPGVGEKPQASDANQSYQSPHTEAGTITVSENPDVDEPASEKIKHTAQSADDDPKTEAIDLTVAQEASTGTVPGLDANVDADAAVHLETSQPNDLMAEIGPGALLTTDAAVKSPEKKDAKDEDELSDSGSELSFTIAEPLQGAVSLPARRNENQVTEEVGNKSEGSFAEFKPAQMVSSLSHEATRTDSALQSVRENAASSGMTLTTDLQTLETGSKAQLLLSGDKPPGQTIPSLKQPPTDQIRTPTKMDFEWILSDQPSNTHTPSKPTNPLEAIASSSERFQGDASKTSLGRKPSSPVPETAAVKGQMHEKANTPTEPLESHAASSAVLKDDTTKMNIGLRTSSPPHSKTVPADTGKSSSALFVEFELNYPEYRGNEQHFLDMIALLKQGKLHRSLWDDFIIRNLKDYKWYCDSLLKDDQGPPLPYERFYEVVVEEAKFQKGIVNPQTCEKLPNTTAQGRIPKTEQPGLLGTSASPTRTMSSGKNRASTPDKPSALPLNQTPLGKRAPETLGESSRNADAKPSEMKQSRNTRKRRLGDKTNPFLKYQKRV